MLSPDYDPDEVRRFERGLNDNKFAVGARNALLLSAPLWAFLGILVFSCAAGAQTTANAGAQSGANAGAEAGALSRSGASITQNYYQSGESRTGVTYGGGTTNRQIIEGGTQDRYRATIRNPPDAYAPNVSGGTNSCLVGVSGAGSVAGFGIGLGGNWSDPNCERRQLAALLHNTGQEALAQEVLCDTDAVRQARQRLGRPCAVDVQQVTAAAPAAIPAPVQAAAPAPVVVQQRVVPEWCYTATAAERRRYPAGTCG